MNEAVAKRSVARRFRRGLFLRLLFYGTPAAVVADALWIEPRWLKVRTLRLAQGKPLHRFVHFTDLHYKGDADYLRATVDRINAQSPEFVCFSGDIVEDAGFLAGALEGLKRIAAPLYGVPGNHDYWSGADFSVIAAAFQSTGGRWLLDESVPVVGDAVEIVGLTCRRGVTFDAPGARPRVVLFHYPAWVDQLEALPFTLALAGHSHGGQVRLPFYGPLVTPFGVGSYDLGLFQTRNGPLYVGAGVGSFYLNVRFNCRPEITVIEI